MPYYEGIEIFKKNWEKKIKDQGESDIKELNEIKTDWMTLIKKARNFPEARMNDTLLAQIQNLNSDLNILGSFEMKTQFETKNFERNRTALHNIYEDESEFKKIINEQNKMRWQLHSTSREGELVEPIGRVRKFTVKTSTTELELFNRIFKNVIILLIAISINTPENVGKYTYSDNNRLSRSYKNYSRIEKLHKIYITVLKVHKLISKDKILIKQWDKWENIKGDR